MTAGRRFLLVSVAALLSGVHGRAQLSLRSVVDLALKNSPRVKIAQADVAKALAVLQESRDVYIPAVSVGAGLGQSYGYSPYPPTLFTSSAQSIVYNGTQYSYIRSARAGFNAARFSLEDVRQNVAEDAVLTYAALQRDQQRQEALRQQREYVERLVQIVGDRLLSGFDTQIDLTTSQLTAAQIRLSQLRTEDELRNDRSHLALLMGLPEMSLRVEGDLPPFPELAASAQPESKVSSAGTSAAFANAKAKEMQALGDSRYLYRPQVSLIVEYNRYATFTNSFQQLQNLNGTKIGANEQVFGVQINLPLFDKLRKAKARESAADAARALHEAENAQNTATEGLGRLRRSALEQQARAEVAKLEQQLAQQQLDALLVQVTATSTGGGPQRTPRDEQNSRIAEREKYLAMIDAAYQLRQVEINLLRQTGDLETWIQSAPISAGPAVTHP